MENILEHWICERNFCKTEIVLQNDFSKSEIGISKETNEQIQLKTSSSQDFYDVAISVFYPISIFTLLSDSAQW